MKKENYCFKASLVNLKLVIEGFVKPHLLVILNLFQNLRLTYKHLNIDPELPKGIPTVKFRMTSLVLLSTLRSKYLNIESYGCRI